MSFTNSILEHQNHKVESGADEELYALAAQAKRKARKLSNKAREIELLNQV